MLCRALGTLARDYPREVSGYNAALGPLMFAFMSDDEEMLASSAIRSFPYVTVPNAEQEKRIVEKVTQVVVHAEPEVAETAFASLSTYLLQMPDLLLVPLCAIFLSSLASRSMTGGGDYRRIIGALEHLQASDAHPCSSRTGCSQSHGGIGLRGGSASGGTTTGSGSGSGSGGGVGGGGVGGRGGRSLSRPGTFRILKIGHQCSESFSQSQSQSHCP